MSDSDPDPNPDPAPDYDYDRVPKIRSVAPSLPWLGCRPSGGGGGGDGDGDAVAGMDIRIDAMAGDAPACRAHATAPPFEAVDLNNYIEGDAGTFIVELSTDDPDVLWTLAETLFEAARALETLQSDYYPADSGGEVDPDA